MGLANGSFTEAKHITLDECTLIQWPNLQISLFPSSPKLNTPIENDAVNKYHLCKMEDKSSLGSRLAYRCIEHL